MSKTKMRCITCGKWFQSANAKDLTCPDCTQKARKEKMAAKTTPPTTGKTPGQGIGTPTRSVPPPPKPKPASGGTSHWLDTQNDVKVGQPDQPVRPKLPPSPAPRDNRGDEERGGYRGPGGYREETGRGNSREGGYRGPGGYRDNDYRSPTPYRVGGGMGLPDTETPRPRTPMTGGPPRGPRPGAPGEPRSEKFRQGEGGKPPRQKVKTPKPKPETPPKPKREKIPPPEPFKPTEEQIAQVEARYKELAVPAEYDGIRTQISKELGIPKTAVKKIIKDLREKEEIPSWWELQPYKGSSEELEKIKAIYEPFLPLPPIGVHKQIAEQLSLKPAEVYQAIKVIRQELNLPQYNDPALHGIELLPKDKKKEAVEVQADEQKTAAVEAQVDEQKTLAVEAPAKDQTEEKKQEPEGEISSIETDTTFHKEGDTTEIVAAGATDTDKTSEA
ncbi:MAG: hypothetical protein ACJ797_11110 [Ktedonobacteraceae bacterium]